MSDKMPELRLREVNRAMVQQLIDREYDSLAGIILRLAWQLGLTRLEIHQLQWDQFSANFSEVTVDGRVIPVEKTAVLFFDVLSEGDTAKAREWVVVSPVTKAPVSEQYISMLVTKTLRSVGMDDIKLSDLRSDFVLRQMEKHPLDYVAQISNLQYFTLKTVYLPFLKSLLKKQALPAKGEDLERITPEQIEQVIRAEDGSTIGIILDLVWNTEIPVSAVATLQWKQANLNQGYLSVDGKRYPLTETLKHRLQELNNQICPAAQDEHIFLTVRSRRPMDAAYIARMARELFVKHGLHGMTLTQVQAMRQKEREEKDLEAFSQKILLLLEKREYVQGGDVSKALNMDEKISRTCLRELEKSGRLNRYGAKYYLPTAGQWSRVYPERIYEYIQNHPGCTRVEIEKALGGPLRSAQPHLSKLISQGKILRERKRYRKTNPGDMCGDKV